MTLAFLTAADALVAAAAVTGITGIVVAALGFWNTKQLKPNGGSSLADAIRRIETTVVRIDDRTHEQGERIAALEAIAERLT